MSDTSSFSSIDTPPSSVSSPRAYANEISEENKQEAARIKAEANKAFQSAFAS